MLPRWRLDELAVPDPDRPARGGRGGRDRQEERVTFETAQAVSLDLAILKVAHTIEVGRHDNVPTGPTEFPGIHCRVNLGVPRRYEGGLSQAILDLEGVARQHGLVLATGIMNEGLTFTTPKDIPEVLKTGWPGQR
jgi:hypothetical protein